jgi:hypothetical protein
MDGSGLEKRKTLSATRTVFAKKIIRNLAGILKNYPVFAWYRTES